MKVVFFGTPSPVVPILETLTKHFEVVAVVTTPDQPAGRKQILTPSPVKVFAEKNNIKILQPEKLLSSLSEVEGLKPDIIVVAAYGKLIPNRMLEAAKHGAINIHPSLLPKYRGPTPIQTTILNGEKTSGITFIKMDAELDHGPILQQIPFTLEKTDTFEWLMQTKFAQAAVMIPNVIDGYVSGKLKPQPQDDTQATFTKMITKEDGHIDLNNPPDETTLTRMIRAYYPWPTVWTIVKLHDKETRIKFLPDNKLQVEGKNSVTVKDFLNGYPEMRKVFEKLTTGLEY
jgi:methionyl-tRNA formyltransferase